LLGEPLVFDWPQLAEHELLLSTISWFVAIGFESSWSIQSRTG
jgi:hypothetical protein